MSDLAGAHSARALEPSFWLACIFIAALPVPGLLELPGGASIAMLVMLLSTPIWFLYARARVSPYDPAASVAIGVILWTAGFLIVWSLFSVFDADTPLRASRYVMSIFGAFAVFFLVRSTISTSRTGLYVDIVVGGLAVTSVLSLLAYRIDFLHDIIFAGTDRAAGLFKNPNQFGMALSTTLPVVLALILASGKRRRYRTACLILMILGLLASGSKTNLLLALATTVATLCGHAIIAYKGPKRVGMLAIYLAGSTFVAIVGVGALALLNPRALAIMATFFGGEGEVTSLTTRSFLWTYSLDQFLADPFFGQGAGQRIDIFYREADVSHSHNVLVDYLRSLGAPGFFGVFAMIGAVVVMCVRSALAALWFSRGAVAGRVVCLGFSLACLSYVAANMSSDSFGPSTSPFFWLFAYLGMATRGFLDYPRALSL
jgi:O-antigen ligase